MSQDAMLWLSRVAMGDLAKSGMGVGEFQVLMCLLGYVDYENHILTPQSEMAEAGYGSLQLQPGSKAAG